MVQVDRNLYAFNAFFKKKVEKASEFFKHLAKVIIKILTKEQPPWKFRYLGPYNNSDLLMIHIEQILERSGNIKPEIKLIYNQIKNEEYFSASVLFCDSVNIKSFAYKTLQSQTAKLDYMMKLVAEPYKEKKIKMDDLDIVIKYYGQIRNLINQTIDVILMYIKIPSRENEIKIENAMVEFSKTLNELSSYISNLIINISHHNKNNSNL